jgi:HCOMODA/2-hydroxy-3-carboxy-muconic semialdehyde decarboxylase
MKKCSLWIVAAAAILSAGFSLAQTAKRKAPPSSGSSALVQELVLANHMLANEGVVDAYGHVSVRDPQNAGHFFLARHVAAGVVTAADIVEYDLDSNAVRGDSSGGYTERFIHGEIYKARPDVMAVVHCHSPELIPFGATSTPLRPIIHLAGFLGEGVPLFEIRKAGGMTDMLIRNPALGHALAQTLANKPAALMRGHGAVVVAPSLHVVVGRAYYMNLDARLQWQAILLGGKNSVTYLDPEEANKSAGQDGFERAWDFWKHRAEAK